MRKSAIKKYLTKNHRILFEQAQKDSDDFDTSVISDREIPDKEWFIQNNVEPAGSRSTRQKIRKRWYLSKGFLIPVAACLALALFFSITPVGRVTASSAYKAVVQLFSGSESMQYGKNEGPAKNVSSSSNIVLYDSLDEVRKAVGVKIAQNHGDVEVESIEVNYDTSSTIITTIYNALADKKIHIKQTIEKDRAEWGVFSSFDQGQSVNMKLPDGSALIGYVTETYAYAVTYKGNMSFELSADGISYDEFVGFIQNTRIE
jgi:hypothetical protein